MWLSCLSDLILAGTFSQRQVPPPSHGGLHAHFHPDFWGQWSESHLQSQALLKTAEGSGRSASLELTAQSPGELTEL